MEYIYLGKLVNTHGIKGEVRILSSFQFKEKVFKPKFNIYIGENKECLTINTYRPHKCFDMVTLEGIDNINDVLKYKGKKVYILKSDLILNNNEYLDSDLIGLDSYYNDNKIGVITDIINNNGYKVFEVNSKFIPYNNNFIELIDINNNKIIFKNLEGII